MAAQHSAIRYSFLLLRCIAIYFPSPWGRMQTVVIPPLNWKSATLFGVPIPPPLNIRIEPQRLEVRVSM
jgi:hypothetical protein